jgi:hypothetical protein
MNVFARLDVGGCRTDGRPVFKNLFTGSDFLCGNFVAQTEWRLQDMDNSLDEDFLSGMEAAREHEDVVGGE